jgi:TolB-like protein/DNA-binding winged helix-turn-helix (wHTH) protein/Tfp pilus assembly protein PilF
LDKASETFNFGPFELRTRSRELYKQGIKLKLRPQPCLILIELLSRPGELITREQLREKLWSSDTFVDFEQSLNTAVKELRAVLGDSAEEPRYVETVPKFGYRFIAQTETVKSAPVPVAADSIVADEAGIPPSADVLHEPPGSRRLAWAALGLTVAAIAIAGYMKVETSIFAHSTKPDRAVASLVVLPLDNLSGDPSQDAFANGLTDLLATELSKIPSLRVVSRTSAAYYKAHPVPLGQLARELNVDAVLEGSMVRSGNRIRLSAQLIDARDDSHLWAESYERDAQDVLSLQDDLSHSVSTALRKELVPSERAGRAHTPSPAAIDAYLRGRSLLDAHSTRDLGRALAYFQEANRADPDFAPSYAASARIYWLLADYGVEPVESLPLMKTASDKALELDDHLAEAHAERGLVLVFLQNDWKSGEAEFRRALELNPGESIAHAYYRVGFLSPLGRSDEAVEEMRRALELDPLSVEFNSGLGAALYFGRRYEEAETQFRKAIEREQTYPGANWFLMGVYEQEQRWPEACRQFQKVYASVENKPLPSGSGAHAACSPREYWKKRVEMQEDIVKDLSDYADLAIVYARSGQNNRALDALDLAAVRNDAWLKYLKVEPAFDSLRDEPRFQQLIKKMNFPPDEPRKPSA